jgi:hypothetical protein
MVLNCSLFRSSTTVKVLERALTEPATAVHVIFFGKYFGKTELGRTRMELEDSIKQGCSVIMV